MPPPPSNGFGVGRGGDVVRQSDKQHYHQQQQRSPIELALPPVHAGARAAPEDFPLPPAPKRRRLGIADAFGQMSLHRRSKLNPALGAQVSLYDSVTSPEESVEAGTGSMVGAGRGPSRNTSCGSSSASGDASSDLELLDSSDVDDELDATSMDEGRTDHLPSLHELSASSSSTGHQDPVDARIEELIRTSRIRAMVSARREAEGRSILRPSHLEAIPSSSPPPCPSPVPRRRSVDLHGKPSSTRSADSGHKRTSTSPKELRSQDWLIEEMAAVEDETHVSPVNIVPVYRGRATTRRATGMRSRSLPRQLETGSSSRTRKPGCTSSDIDTAP